MHITPLTRKLLAFLKDSSASLSYLFSVLLTTEIYYVIGKSEHDVLLTNYL